jgi:hypothetical protein
MSRGRRHPKYPASSRHCDVAASAHVACMWNHVKSSWAEIKRLPPGKRFEALYEKQRARRSPLGTLLLSVAALLCFAIGTVLMFVPGPAALFFAIAIGLITSQSLWAAERADRLDAGMRALWHRRTGTRSHQ